MSQPVRDAKPSSGGPLFIIKIISAKERTGVILFLETDVNRVDSTDVFLPG